MLVIQTPKTRRTIGNFDNTVQISRISYIFEKRKYLLSTELFKVSKILDTKPVMYRLSDMKYDEIS